MSGTGDSQQEWHAIRPWAPPLSLSVREISSVSATFILSSSLHDVDDHLALEAEAHDGDAEAGNAPSTSAIISDVLAKGLSVNVNEAPWQRVLIRIDDKVDEAVIIIYGLMPGRQYDIDLGLVQGSESNVIRRQVITEDFEFPKVDEATIEDDGSSSSSDQGAPSTPSSSSVSAGRPAVANGSPPSSVASSFTMEDRLAQVEQTLSALMSEKETLTQALKSARRDAQKTDAALRSEIDALKRASEKNSVAEQRARQRVLALQESVKRANAAREELEEEAAALEESLPGLERTRSEREAKHRELKRSADQARKARERSEEKARKKTAAMESELAALDTRAERLQAKRTKLEGTVLPDLEEQLRELERELQRAEMEELYGGELDEPLDTDVTEFGEVFANPLFPPRQPPTRAPSYPPLGGSDTPPSASPLPPPLTSQWRQRWKKRGAIAQYDTAIRTFAIIWLELEFAYTDDRSEYNNTADEEFGIDAVECCATF
ncbi:uncharacterized protein SCHCODRAFT_02680494 [Schizophyllum commune H4-8]|uniref:Uncharacterized protein n=1 Tax=Schizophyllum commune (strain H4-8 / FGSC 9210) TaxID=578458 RepID=D8QDJ8_SCHCM|nr:uncharacterized protein SCHCODRAFT_02680494 [Schizophyllum commune H4-8]KAI5888690.1 hypothetical protein SCHCODRAFT_02680494 [Schizophyllum commune H4-8]